MPSTSDAGGQSALFVRRSWYRVISVNAAAAASEMAATWSWFVTNAPSAIVVAASQAMPPRSTSPMHKRRTALLVETSRQRYHPNVASLLVYVEADRLRELLPESVAGQTWRIGPNVFKEPQLERLDEQSWLFI